MNVDRPTLDFLARHEVAVLSSIDRTGNLTGAPVYYVFENGFFYILTKQGTQKAHNMMGQRRVALTVYDTDALQLVQAQGTADIESDALVRERVYERVVRPRTYKSGAQLPPVTHVHTGGFVVFRIAPHSISFSDYN